MTTIVNVVGTIATDPRIITTNSGTRFCAFRLASDERRYDREKQAWVEGHTNWFGVVCFRTLGVHAHTSFKKGDRVIVSGKLRVRTWEKDEKRGTSIEIEADALGHDLRWGVSTFEKTIVAQQAVENEPTPPAPEVPSLDDAVADTGHAASQEPTPGLTTSTGEASIDGFTPSLAAA